MLLVVMLCLAHKIQDRLGNIAYAEASRINAGPRLLRAKAAEHRRAEGASPPTHELRAFGFERTKPTFFTRLQRWIVEFVHLHKYTFGACFRAHLGVRVRNESFAAAALNGPTEDLTRSDNDAIARNFEFTPKLASMRECGHAINSCVAAEGLAWFELFHEPNRPLTEASPSLHEQQRLALSNALSGGNPLATSHATRKVLNVT